MKPKYTLIGSTRGAPGNPVGGQAAWGRDSFPTEAYSTTFVSKTL